MKIAVLSNAPWGHTGYSNQTKMFCPRLKALGHNLAIIAFYGLEGGILRIDDMPVYPRGYHPYGMDVMAAHSNHFGADVMISLMDSWVFDARLLGNVRWVPWFPVDHEPLPNIIRERVSKSYLPIVYSRFGEQMARDAGLDVRYVPHGVETSVFKPTDKHEARERLKWPKDAYVFGMVAANKGTPSRKAFPQQIEAFAEFHKRHPDALLYLHTTKSENGEGQGVNLPELVRYLGIEQAVIFADQYHNLLGYPDPAMVDLYNAMDVLLSVSMGEGFGIPILEAQSCGTPVIVGDWTSMGELCFAGWKVAKSHAEKYWTPLAAYQYLPRIGAIVDVMERAYSHRNSAILSANARMGAMEYDADLVTEQYWRPVLGEIEDRVRMHKEILAGVS